MKNRLPTRGVGAQYIAPWIIGIVILLSSLPLHAQEELLPYTVQELELNDQTPRQVYTFTAVAESVWSFSAVTLTGTLDPVLRLLDADENYLVGNDNETRTSRNARLENWQAPADGTYWLEISREASSEGATFGRARLTVTGDADSLALSPLPIPEQIELRAGQVYEVIPLLNVAQMPLSLRFTVDFAPEDAFALQMRSSDPTGWGDWLLVIGAEGVTLQDTARNSNEELYQRVLLDIDQALTPGDYHLVIEPERLSLRVDEGEPLEISSAELPDFRFVRLGYQPLRLLAMPFNSAPVSIQNPYASAPFYNDTVWDAVPPAVAGQRLYQFANAPLRMVEELRQLGYLSEGGGLAFAVPDGVLETSAVGFSSFPFNMKDGFGDFVLAFYASVRVGAADTACGMTFRAVDGSNFSTALFSADGNAYLLPYQAGVLTDTALALASPWIAPGVGAENHVLLVAQAATVDIFINGYWLGETTLSRQRGTLGLNMVVNSAELTRCTYRNIWLWSLDQPLNN